MKNILLSINFNEFTETYLERALSLIEPDGAKVWLLHIALPEPDFVGFGPGPQYIRDTRAEKYREEHVQLQRYADRLSAKGIRAEGLLIQGATIDMILQEAEKLRTDLIIMGHEEQTFLYRMFFGSTSMEVARQSKVPVLIIPIDRPDDP